MAKASRNTIQLKQSTLADEHDVDSPAYSPPDENDQEQYYTLGSAGMINSFIQNMEQFKWDDGSKLDGADNDSIGGKILFPIHGRGPGCWDCDIFLPIAPAPSWSYPELMRPPKADGGSSRVGIGGNIIVRPPFRPATPDDITPRLPEVDPWFDASSAFPDVPPLNYGPGSDIGSALLSAGAYNNPNYGLPAGGGGSFIGIGRFDAVCNIPNEIQPAIPPDGLFGPDAVIGPWGFPGYRPPPDILFPDIMPGPARPPEWAEPPSIDFKEPDLSEYTRPELPSLDVDPGSGTQIPAPGDRSNLWDIPIPGPYRPPEWASPGYLDSLFETGGDPPTPYLVARIVRREPAVVEDVNPNDLMSMWAAGYVRYNEETGGFTYTTAGAKFVAGVNVRVRQNRRRRYASKSKEELLEENLRNATVHEYYEGQWREIPKGTDLAAYFNNQRRAAVREQWRIAGEVIVKAISYSFLAVRVLRAAFAGRSISEHFVRRWAERNWGQRGFGRSEIVRAVYYGETYIDIETGAFVYYLKTKGRNSGLAVITDKRNARILDTAFRRTGIPKKWKKIPWEWINEF